MIESLCFTLPCKKPSMGVLTRARSTWLIVEAPSNVRLGEKLSVPVVVMLLSFTWVSSSVMIRLFKSVVAFSENTALCSMGSICAVTWLSMASWLNEPWAFTRACPMVACGLWFNCSGLSRFTVACKGKSGVRVSSCALNESGTSAWFASGMSSCN